VVVILLVLLVQRRRRTRRANATSPSSIAARTAFVNPLYDAPPPSLRGVDGPSRGVINPVFLDPESPSPHAESYSEVHPSNYAGMHSSVYASVYGDAQATSTFSNPMYSLGGFAVPADNVYSSTDYTHDGLHDGDYDVPRFAVPTDSGDYLDLAPEAARDGAYASRTADTACSPYEGQVHEVPYERLPGQGAAEMVYAHVPTSSVAERVYAQAGDGTAVVVPKSGYDRAYVLRPSAKSGYDTLYGTNAALPGELLVPE